MGRRKAGRALVLLGVALLLVRSVLCCAWIELPALQEVLADVLQRGPEGALSGEVGYLKTYQLLGNVLIGVCLFCVAVLALLLLRGGRARALGPLAAHLLGFSLHIIRWGGYRNADTLLVALGVAATIAGAALLARRRPRGGSAPARYGRAAGDVATLGLAFASGVYLNTACCVVANEFYASGMAKLAEQVGHAVDRGWVALRLAHFVAASAISLLVGVKRPGPGGEAGRGCVALRAAGCAALAALMLRDIAEHYRYYTPLPRLQQVTICLCALCLVGEALARAGSSLMAPPARPRSGRTGRRGRAGPGPAQAPLRRRRGRLLPDAGHAISEALCPDCVFPRGRAPGRGLRALAQPPRSLAGGLPERVCPVGPLSIVPRRLAGGCAPP